MTERSRAEAPSAAAIERRFRSPAVLVSRPIITGGLKALGAVRRYKWTGVGAAELIQHGQPLIFAANHCSHADTAAILGTLPWRIRRFTCVAAALDVFGPLSNTDKLTLRGVRRECLHVLVAAGFNAFAFDRHGSPLKSLRAAVELIQKDWNLLLYPEGTRSRTGKLGEFKSGVAILAKRTGRPVVPVHVHGGDSILPCGVSMPQAGHAIVRYGTPLTLRKGQSASDFTTEIQNHVRDLGELTKRKLAVRERAMRMRRRASFTPAASADTRSRSR
jgi:1-acyl-sn-glycerol-3-phosphate acyltransferase